MPDPAKFEKLREIGYAVPVTCGLCIHREFTTRTQLWGSCKRSTYVHGKHTGEPRQVSIYRAGTCGSSKLDPDKIWHLQAHAEFLPEGAEG